MKFLFSQWFGSEAAAARANLLIVPLLIIGCVQMTGFLFRSRAMVGLGAASAASPCPAVFCSVPVYGEPGVLVEVFSLEFSVVYEQDGREVVTVVTPELFSRLKGPFNRRNNYAALAYGACLPPDLMDQTFTYALNTPGTLREELGLPDDVEHLRVRIAGRTNGPSRVWDLEPGKIAR